MAILDVVQIGHPVLWEHAKEVDASEIVTPETQQLVADMVETMRAAPGVGLAAPQVTKSIRLFVGEALPSKRRPDASPMELLVIFNPVITVLDRTWNEDWEGCLSIDRSGMWGKVKRYQRVRIEGLGPDAQPVVRELEDFHARIVQHETDHLDGILFFDRIYERLKKREQPVIASFDNYTHFYRTNKADQSSTMATEASDTQAADTEH